MNSIEAPFDLKYVHCITDISEIPSLNSEPCVILATSDTLERGFSRKLFLKYIGNSTNLIIFTTKEPDDDNIELAIAALTEIVRTEDPCSIISREEMAENIKKAFGIDIKP